MAAMASTKGVAIAIAATAAAERRMTPQNDSASPTFAVKPR